MSDKEAVSFSDYMKRLGETLAHVKSGSVVELTAYFEKDMVRVDTFVWTGSKESIQELCGKFTKS